MKGFIIGVLLTLLLVFGGGYLYLRSGRMDFSASTAPGKMETKLAHMAIDASTEHHAPDIKNPQAPTGANLLTGAREYEEHCTLCHGSPQANGMNLGEFLYPPAPQLLRRPMHDPENEFFYIIKQGVRMTGMPAWEKHMSDEEIWDIVTLMKNINNVPPSVVAEWKKAAEPNNGQHVEREEHEERQQIQPKR
jgi:mono/diheme cytochrome c family protein